MVGWFYARQIVEEDAAKKAADKFSGQFERFDDAYEALKWLLARKCDDVEYLSRINHGVEYRLYRQASDDLAGTPNIAVLYTCDDDEVVFVGVHAYEPEEEID